MTLPNELQVAIAALVLFLVVNGLKELAHLTGRDLTGWATVIAGVISATVIFFLNQILALLPASAQPLVQTIFTLLILLLGAMGIKRVEKVVSHSL